MPKILAADDRSAESPVEEPISLATPPARAGVDVDHINKRDLPSGAPLDYLEFLFNRRARRVPYFEAVAVDDQGVFETLNTVSRMVLVKGFAQQPEGAPR